MFCGCLKQAMVITVGEGTSKEIFDSFFLAYCTTFHCTREGKFWAESLLGRNLCIIHALMIPRSNESTLRNHDRYYGRKNDNNMYARK